MTQCDFRPAQCKHCGQTVTWKSLQVMILFTLKWWWWFGELLDVHKIRERSLKNLDNLSLVNALKFIENFE